MTKMGQMGFHQLAITTIKHKLFSNPSVRLKTNDNQNDNDQIIHVGLVSVIKREHVKGVHKYSLIFSLIK